MINQTYTHSHECNWKDHKITVKPVFHGDHYIPDNAPMCSQLHTELELVETKEVENENMGQIVMGEEPKPQET